MQVYELFDGSGPGAYWFWASSARSWIVADLDTGKSYQLPKLIRLDIRAGSEAEDILERKNSCLAKVEQRVLLTADDALRVVRDFVDDCDLVTVVEYTRTGEVDAGPMTGKRLATLAAILKKNRKQRPKLRD